MESLFLLPKPSTLPQSPVGFQGTFRSSRLATYYVLLSPKIAVNEQYGIEFVCRLIKFLGSEMLRSTNTPRVSTLG